jgi:hypothetical protein
MKPFIFMSIAIKLQAATCTSIFATRVNLIVNADLGGNGAQLIAWQLMAILQF